MLGSTNLQYKVLVPKLPVSLGLSKLKLSKMESWELNSLTKTASVLVIFTIEFWLKHSLNVALAYELLPYELLIFLHVLVLYKSLPLTVGKAAEAE